MKLTIKVEVGYLRIGNLYPLIEWTNTSMCNPNNAYFADQSDIMSTRLVFINKLYIYIY